MRRFVVDLLFVFTLFLLVAEFARWRRLDPADHLFLVYVHIVICNVLIEFNEIPWKVLWHIDLAQVEKTRAYALLTRFVSQLVACSLVCLWHAVASR